MSCDRALYRMVAALVAGCFLVAGAARAAPMDEVIPEDLPQARKDALKRFLTKLEKPNRFVPPKAKVVGPALPGVNPPIDQPAVKGGAIKEYLAEVRPYPAADRRRGPDKADVYWFRPNPQKGGHGLTLKRTVDLNTGKQIGDTEVLLNYAAPLTREEQTRAIQLARKTVLAVAKLYSGAGKGQIEVVGLFEQLTASAPDGAPGDRMVNLQFRRKRSPNVISVNVNVTRETARELK